jgi:hypothetical protein
MELPLQFIKDIQAKYFRTGVYTHLHIVLDDHAASDSLLVCWTFTFQDLGCTHSIARASVVSLGEDGGVLVDGLGHGLDTDAAERAIFHGHYEDYVREMYRECGIRDDNKDTSNV